MKSRKVKEIIKTLLHASKLASRAMRHEFVQWGNENIRQDLFAPEVHRVLCSLVLLILAHVINCGNATHNTCLTGNISCRLDVHTLARRLRVRTPRRKIIVNVDRLWVRGVDYSAFNCSNGPGKRQNRYKDARVGCHIFWRHLLRWWLSKKILCCCLRVIPKKFLRCLLLGVAKIPTIWLVGEEILEVGIFIWVHVKA